jgi:D-amino-acid dehydrogenase
MVSTAADLVPVIGKGERHHGLWFAFGHAHHGRR